MLEEQEQQECLLLIVDDSVKHDSQYAKFNYFPFCIDVLHVAIGNVSANLMDVLFDWRENMSEGCLKVTRLDEDICTPLSRSWMLKGNVRNRPKFFIVIALVMSCHWRMMINTLRDIYWASRLTFLVFSLSISRLTWSSVYIRNRQCWNCLCNSRSMLARKYLDMWLWSDS